MCTNLFLGGGKHGENGETDGLDGESGTPVLGENGEADVAIAVDVRVDGHVLPGEDDLGGVEGVLGAEHELEGEGLALVEGAVRALEVNVPAED